MDAIEKRARQILDSHVDGYWLEDQGRCVLVEEAVSAIIAALTPPEGHVVVTRNEAGQAVAVTRQDDEGRILSVIAEFSPPEGNVLVPVDQDSVDFYVCDACGHHYMQDGVNCDCIPSSTARPLRHVRMIAARQEVKNVND